MRFNEELAAIYQQVASTYGDARRTKISDTDEWESSASGKVEKDAYCYLSPTEYIAAYSRDDEDLGGVDENSVSVRGLGEPMCIVTNGLRAFLRDMGDFAYGRHSWSELLPLKEGEVVLSVLSKSEFDALSRVTFEMADGTERTVHPSFITTAASKRGKRVLPGKGTATAVVPVE